MKSFYLISAFLFCAWNLLAQGPFRVDGTIKNFQKKAPEAGVKIELIQNGATVYSTVSTSNGRYLLKGNVDYKSPFTVVYTKSGFVKKFIAFDFSAMNPEDAPAGDFAPIKSGDVDLIQSDPKLDLAFLNSEPVAKFTWNPNTLEPNHDAVYSDKIKVKIEKVLSALIVNNDAQYNAIIKEADAFYTQQKWEEAREKYLAAIDLKLTEAHPNNRIIELDALILAKKKAELANQNADTDYQNLIKAADLLRDQKKYEQAILKYEEAKRLKDEVYPNDQIYALQKLVESEKKYKEAVAQADMFYTQKSYLAAKDKYTLANKLKPEEPHPIARLAELKKKEDEINAAADKKKKYETALAEADALFDQQKWDEAKLKYKDVLLLEPSATYPDERIKVCDVKIAEIAAQKAKEAKIAQLIQEGNDLFTASKWNESKLKFTQVLNEQSDNAIATLKLAEIELKLKEAAEFAAKEAQYKKLIAEGDLAVKALKWSDAKLKFDEAFAMKQDDAALNVKIQKVNEELKKIADQEALNQKFLALKAEGLDLATKEQWLDAKTKLTEAQAIKVDPQITTKLSEIEAKIKANEALLKAEKEYNDLLAAAKTLEDQKNYDAAIAKYKEASQKKLTEQFPKDKIAELTKIKSDLASQNELIKKYKEYLQKGKDLMAQNKHVDALKELKLALSTKSDETEPVALIATCEKIIKENEDAANKLLADKEALEKKFQDLKNEGMDLASKEQWLDAKSKLTEAQAIKVDPQITTKLTEIEAKIKANEALLKTEKEYNDLLAAAKTLEDQKNYDAAIVKYKEASQKKLTEQFPKDKIAELTKLKNDLAANDINEKNYQAFMQKGKDLMAQQKYLDAIKEFNSALNVKNSATEPVELAKECERLEKAKGSEEDAKIEKIFTVAQTKFTEGDMVKAKELANRYLTFKKDEPRALELLKKIEAFELNQQAYKTKIAQADKFLSEKSLEKALDAYQQAKLLLPNETYPQQKIDEINQLIVNNALALDKDKIYLAHMEKGVLSENSKIWDQALIHYQNALDTKPGDKAATEKIAHIQKLIDEEKNASKSILENKEKFNLLIKKADEFFAQESYLSAKTKYEEALKIFGDDAYAKTQVQECVTREKNKGLAEFEKNYLKLITKADENFASKDYQKAKDYYTRATKIKKDDQYPVDKLKEIENILNPQVVESLKLEDLGVPFNENSIMDGEALLRKAENERKNIKDKKVETIVTNATNTTAELNNEAIEKQKSTTNEIYQITSKIAHKTLEDDEQRQAIVRELERTDIEINDLNIAANQYKQNELLTNQDVLTTVKNENELDYGDRDLVHQANAELIKAQNTAIENEKVNQSTIDKNANIQDDAVLKLISINMEGINTSSVDKQKGNEAIINDVKINAANVVADKQDSKTNVLYSNDKELYAINVDVEEKKINDAKYAPENKEQLNTVVAVVTDAEKVRNEIAAERVVDNSLSMTNIQGEMYVDYSDRDINRKENVEVYKKNESEILEGKREKFTSENLKYLKNKDKIEYQEINRKEVYDKDKVQVSENVTALEVKTIQAKDNYEARGMSDDQQRSKMRSDIEILEGSNETYVAEKKNEHVENVDKIDQLEKKITVDNVNKVDAKKEDLYKAKSEIEKVESEKPSKVKVKNALGEEYPEGVSQESFQQNDENGLMKAIITRRVVVIQGEGNIYVRTQTLNGTTYTKNNQPSTEQHWVKETNASNLTKHF